MNFTLFPPDGESSTLESHPLQLDTAGSSGSHQTISPAEVDVKKGPRDSETHGTCLTLNDHDRIRQFIQEFTFRGLLPHIEKNIRQLNDQVQLQVLTLNVFNSGLNLLLM